MATPSRRRSMATFRVLIGRKPLYTSSSISTAVSLRGWTEKSVCARGESGRREAETPALLTICSTWSLLNFQHANHTSNAHLKSLAYEQRAHWHHALMKSANNYNHYHIANARPHDDNHLPSYLLIVVVGFIELSSGLRIGQP